jgi:hypothetical protein
LILSNSSILRPATATLATPLERSAEDSRPMCGQSNRPGNALQRVGTTVEPPDTSCLLPALIRKIHRRQELEAVIDWALYLPAEFPENLPYSIVQSTKK